MAFGKMLDKVKEQGEQFKEKSQEIKKIDISMPELNLKEKGLDKIKDTIVQVTDALPVIKKAGYAVNEIEIGMGLPPSVVVHLMYEEGIDDDEKVKILEELGENKVGTMLLKSLLKATEVQAAIKMGNLKFKEIEVEMSVPPSVTIKFVE